ncbi:MAG: ribosomal protein S6 modification protein [Gammaproteobacteria bacterium RIFCSPHIGHO2_12_FULL_43_28]|nr:MAG: ribosomal protein S6 modification protein [Gammaproteobacteria bacterium RIFCSPHIGHO2_12_FULL_43_28]
MQSDKNIILIKPLTKYPVLGWREWVILPQLGIDKIKAKIDTGARTSALHAFALEPFTEDGRNRIRFDIHPLQHNTDVVVTCVADVIDKRLVTDSGGHEEDRYVIETLITIGGLTWTIEITLTERETMLFRMLIGRSALRKRFLVNPARSFVTTRQKQK